MDTILPTPAAQANVPERVNVYIDGYNVYYGLKHKGWTRYLWLDYRSLFQNEMRGSQQLNSVKYFTATNRKQPSDSHHRQKLYLRALELVGGVEIRTDGRFEVRPWRCNDCGSYHDRIQEKKTDVAIAVAMLHNAFSDDCDTIWLMSADADLVPAVSYIRAHFPDVTVVILPPRGRRSDDLIEAAHAKRDLSRARYANAHFPDLMVFTGNEMLRRPAEWS